MTARPALFAIAILLLSGTAAHAADAGTEALDAGAVRALLSGNTLAGESQLARFRDLPDRHFEVYLDADGSLVIRNFEGETDTGEWEVTEDGQFCNQYAQTRRGMRKCYWVRTQADAYILIDTDRDTVTTVFRMRPGSPDWR